MIRAERRLAGRQRALKERPRPGEIAVALKQNGEIAEARRGLRMVGAERRFADRQRALKERSRRPDLALGLEQVSEIGKALGRLGMILPKHCLADRERAFVERPCRGVSGQRAMPVRAEPIEQRCLSTLRIFRDAPITADQRQRQGI